MANIIKAKVLIYSVEDNGERENKYSENVVMQPVHGTGEENKSYSEATPSGKIQLTITNKSAWGFFVKDKEYFVDFTPA